MLTLFAVPKPFIGHVALVQRNAITSWTRLSPGPEIILFGDEPGTYAICNELGLRHLPHVERNEFKTPLVSDLFRRAQYQAKNDLLCYVNADIILLSHFIQAVDKVKYWDYRFLMIGKRWDMAVRELLDFDNDSCEEELIALARNSGHQHSHKGIDYFVFPRGLYTTIPPFAIGRLRWDNWLVWFASKHGSKIIDATPVVTAIHQNHDVGLTVNHSVEKEHNHKLAGGTKRLYSIADAEYRLTHTGIKRNLSFEHFLRKLEVLYHTIRY